MTTFQSVLMIIIIVATVGPFFAGYWWYRDGCCVCNSVSRTELGRGRMSDPDHTTTAGEALFKLDRPLAEFPNRRPWAELTEHERFRYEQRASDILATADQIRIVMKESMRG
jgi:hypothetical protein